MDRGNCIIITRTWALEAGLLSWYTAWNYTSNCIKQSNDLVLSRTRCQSGMCADPWTVLCCERSVPVKSWWCWKRTTSVLMKPFRWGVKHLPVAFSGPVNPLLDLYIYKCCILLAFISVGGHAARVPQLVIKSLVIWANWSIGSVLILMHQSKENV